MKIELKHLSEVDKKAIIALHNHPLVKRHMPLSKGYFDEQSYDAFIADKKKLWDEHGYGPWAFLINHQFVGWGGLQYEAGEADLALVLHPEYWGMGKVIYQKIIEEAISLQLKSITALLPLSRTRTQGMLKLGFKPDGELSIEGETFIRYRLLLTLPLRSSLKPLD